MKTIPLNSRMTILGLAASAILFAGLQASATQLSRSHFGPPSKQTISVSHPEEARVDYAGREVALQREAQVGPRSRQSSAWRVSSRQPVETREEYGDRSERLERPRRAEVPARAARPGPPAKRW